MKRFIAVVLTCSILIVSFGYVERILSLKTPALILEYWKKEENKNTDIMLLGPSTLGANIDLAELWEKNGIAGYNMGISGSTMYDSYHRLVEAEKSHHIQMLILDVCPMYYKTVYSDYQAKLENVSVLAWSWNKLNYVQAAVPAEERLLYFLGFPLFHDRYQSLSRWDYKFTTIDGEYDKGTRWRYYNKVDSLDLINAKDICTYKAVGEKAKYYFEKVIDYCKKNNIELLCIKTPDGRRKQNQPIYNAVEVITEKYEIPYVDFNLYDESINIVPLDFADDHHLNISGARKCADFLGEYLVSHYNLPDHRGDADYASWDRFAANRENLYLRAITDNTDYFKELARDNKSVMVTPYRLARNESEDYIELQELLQSINYFDWDKEDVLYGAENAESFVFGDNEVIITKDYGNCEIKINEENKINLSQPGLLLVIYDSVNDEIADIVEFERDNGYALKHLYNP